MSTKSPPQYGRGKYMFAGGGVAHDGEWRDDQPVRS